MPNNTIVGIDLSFRNTGLVVARPVHTALGYEIIDLCNVRTHKADKKKALFVAQDDVTECQKLYEGVSQAIASWNPTAAVVELPTAGAKGARANRCMGMATGMVAALAASTGLPFIWVQPDDSKIEMCGKRTASKEEMIRQAKKNWPKAPWPTSDAQAEHVADAAAALLVARRSDVYKLIRGKVE